MFSHFVLVAFFFFGLVASQSTDQKQYPFNVTVGTNTTLFPSDLLIVPDSQVKTACNNECTVATAALAKCNPTDGGCFCNPETVNPFVNCETCMFHFLIDKNLPEPNFTAGSNVIVSGYAAECAKLNVTLLANQSALTLPASWDGPFVAVLPIGGAAVAVTGAAILGVSALLILSNLE
ncbi:hypothetical protein CPC08DRAFT_749859 [Agrocybe pediades]|nr:hypothetical protein CPC08DRAFT_749859 [Agrocybe pediades]